LLGWPGFCAADGAFARKTTLLRGFRRFCSERHAFARRSALLLGAARKSLYFSGLAPRLA
jgi:hypothetical protein